MSTKRPGPFLCRLLRLPARLYDWRAGWLVGGRFLRLTHVGRRTGSVRQTILQVLGTAKGEVIVMAGRGRSADWYRNLPAQPAPQVAGTGHDLGCGPRTYGGHLSKVDPVTLRRIAAKAGVPPALVGFLQVLRRMEGLLGAGVVLLLDWNAGWLAGRRFLVLGHIGRVTGRHYRTVLEVIRTDPASGEVMVIAPLGGASHWYRNLQAQPTVNVAVGRRRFQASHRDLDEREAAAVLTDYERRHRWVGHAHNGVLSRVGGWRYDGSEDARRRLARQCRMVALRAVDDQGRRPGQSG